MDKLINNEKLLDLSPFLYCVTDPLENKLIYCNKEAAEMFGDWEKLGLSAAFEENSQLKEYILSGKTEKATHLQMIKGGWYIICLSRRELEGRSLLFLTGTDITYLVYDGYIDPNKVRNPKTGTFDRQIGLNYLESNINGLRSGKKFPFTVSYIELDKPLTGESFDEVYIKEFSKTVSSTIRNTDIFTDLGDGVFMIIFPKCTFNIVENIMSTIETKLDYLSSHENARYHFSINYAILEITRDNLADKDTILQRAKSLLY